MAGIQDHAYVKVCAQLATALGISLASARRQVDQTAAKEGSRDPKRRLALASEMLEAVRSGEPDAQARLDQLLSSSEGAANFILED